MTCAGHGVCLDGVLGTGECVCMLSFSFGFWGGRACENCLSGYYGSDCRLPCPTNTAFEVCSAHGTCRDGRAGDGTCACDPNYAGPACATVCPVANGAVCNGVGTCNDGAAGDGRCSCSAAERGRWAGDACTACAFGWVGVFCDLPCPVGPADAPCAGHGTCAPKARVAVCTCVAGYAGAACATECPGGAMDPCSGHGRCVAATATCSCDSASSSGYWGGAKCDACALGWSGKGCNIPCPVSARGVPCSGARCWRGTCICDAGACGSSCNVTGSACDALVCPTGLWGPNCGNTCPGGTGSVCSGHGICHRNGACECVSGWAGEACREVCPGGTAAPCSGHGVCVQATALCECQATYATVACAVQCPVVAGEACAGHGACRDGAASDGACVCDPGYATTSCSTLCPGTVRRGNVTDVCSGHGLCDPATAACACDTVSGQWAGADCGVCAPGWFGADCAEECVNGRTEGRTCVCDPSYGLPNCSAACPGADRDCSGHGVCLDGADRNGTCACNATWFTSNCSVACEPHLCFAPEVYPVPHARCNPATGACECQDDDAGHWGGPNCNRCRVGFWGQQCDLVCTCSGHGACGWLDGVCECFADDEAGHWAGDRCETCAEGYLVPLCIARNVRISRAGDLTAVGEGIRYDGTSMAVVDEAYRLVYTGGQPLLVFHSEDGSPAAQMSLNGVCVCVRTRACTCVRACVCVCVHHLPHAFHAAQGYTVPLPQLKNTALFRL